MSVDMASLVDWQQEPPAPLEINDRIVRGPCDRGTVVQVSEQNAVVVWDEDFAVDTVSRNPASWFEKWRVIHHGA